MKKPLQHKTKAGKLTRSAAVPDRLPPKKEELRAQLLHQEHGHRCRNRIVRAAEKQAHYAKAKGQQHLLLKDARFMSVRQQIAVMKAAER